MLKTVIYFSWFVGITLSFAVADAIFTGNRANMMLFSLGGALLALHVTQNPRLILNPIENNTLVNGKWTAMGQLGLFLMVVGLLVAAMPGNDMVYQSSF